MGGGEVRKHPSVLFIFAMAPVKNRKTRFATITMTNYLPQIPVFSAVFRLDTDAKFDSYFHSSACLSHITIFLFPVMLVYEPQSKSTKQYPAHYHGVCCVLPARVQFCQFDKATAHVYYPPKAEG